MLRLGLLCPGDPSLTGNKYENFIISVHWPVFSYYPAINCLPVFQAHLCKISYWYVLLLSFSVFELQNNLSISLTWQRYCDMIQYVILWRSRYNKVLNNLLTPIAGMDLIPRCSGRHTGSNITCRLVSVDSKMWIGLFISLLILLLID